MLQDLKPRLNIKPILSLVLLLNSSSQQGLDTFTEGDEADEESTKSGLIYARVSSSGQVDSSEDSDGNNGHEGSIDDQVDEMKEVAKDLGVPLYSEPIKDKAKTGTDFDREGIEQIFQLSQEEQVGYLFAQEVDRIGRSAAETLYFIHLLQSECGVTLVTPTRDHDVTSIEGLLHTTLLSLIAEVQNDIRADKVQKSKVRGFIDGKKWKKCYPIVPAGYRLTDDGWLEPLPGQIKAIKEVFEVFLETESYAETKRQVEERHEGVLDGHRVKTLLQNSVYIGKPSVPENWVNDMSIDHVVDAPELKLIEREMFEQAQEIIERKNDLHSTDKETQDMTDFVEEFDLFTVISSIDPVTLLHCGTPMKKNGQKNLKGDFKTHQYKCQKCGTVRKCPKENEYDRMELAYKLLSAGSDEFDFLDR